MDHSYTNTPNPLVRSADHLDDDDEMPSASRARHTVDDVDHPGVHSSNLRTLRSSNPTQDARDFMRRYFSNLVGLKPGLSKMYFDKSCLTFNGSEIAGDRLILLALVQLRECPFYNIQFLSAQPTLGNGIFIICKGCSPGHIFHMNFMIVSIRKKYRILNQFIEFSTQMSSAFPNVSLAPAISTPPTSI